MEKPDRKIVQGSGLIIIVCALGISLLNALVRNPLDSYIMPFILLMAGVIFLLRKPEVEHRKLLIGKATARILIATLSISLVGGIVLLLLTLL